MVERLVRSIPGRDVVDVGCGTGIAGRQFQAAGCRVIGVEPDERMAALARESGLDVEVARFETWDPANRSFDLVMAGQSWHWVDPRAGADKAAAVLRPAGRFAAFWNAFQPPGDLAGAFADVYRRVETGLPFNPWARPPLDAYAAMCEKASESLVRSGAFDEPENWQFAWERTYTRTEWLDQVPTFGGHGQMPGERLEELLSGLGQAIDDVGGDFVMAFTTVVVTALRRPSPGPLNTG